METRFNRGQKLVVAVMDVLLLVELTVSIFLGQQDPENMTVIFLGTFIPMALVTLIVSRIIIGRMRDKSPSVSEIPADNPEGVL